MDIEVCIDSVEGAITASQFGVKRVELCSSLELGGLTPSAGLIKEVVQVSKAEVYVMIRPKGGGFVYDGHDISVMLQDIAISASLGAKGIVFGVLNEDNTLDVKRNAVLIEWALRNGLGTTFHRAIDVCKDPISAIDDLVNLGFDRILTSGQSEKAEEGMDLIRKMIRTANGRIQIMAGSGINAGNVKQIADLGVNAIHFTARKMVKNEDPMSFGIDYEVDSDKIEAITSILQ